MKDQIACINAYIYALPSPWSIVFQLGRSCHYTTCRQHTDRQTDRYTVTYTVNVRAVNKKQLQEIMIG